MSGFAAVLAALCVAVAGGPAGGLRRLETTAERAPRAGGRAARGRGAGARGRLGRAVLAAVAGAGAWLLLGGLAGMLSGLLLAGGCLRALGRAHRRATADTDDRAVARALPLACDVLAAAVASGLPVPAALRWVAAAVPDRVGQEFAEVAANLELGASPEEAWAALAALPAARPLARAAVRTADSGAALSGACTALADELRATRQVEGQRAARRAGVAVTAPLALCFLPAFLLLGVVPFAAGLLHGLLG